MLVLVCQKEGLPRNLFLHHLKRLKRNSWSDSNKSCLALSSFPRSTIGIRMFKSRHSSCPQATLSTHLTTEAQIYKHDARGAESCMPRCFYQHASHYKGLSWRVNTTAVTISDKVRAVCRASTDPPPASLVEVLIQETRFDSSKVPALHRRLCNEDNATKDYHISCTSISSVSLRVFMWAQATPNLGPPQMAS